uniref:Uncharacterized protein n=1 Tax=viral metagenome TaxID=1070528 RepID=A0A6C0ADF7_9ZZZZ
MESHKPFSPLQCNCEKCKKVIFNLENGVWYHDGKSKIKNEPKHGDKYETSKIFDEPTLRSLTGYWNKPIGSIWFSAGSWLYDPFCDMRVTKNSHFCDDEFAKELHFREPNKKSVFQIKSPKNILEIKTYKELKDFHDKYHIVEMSSSVNWINVKNDGYYGVSFHFRKFTHLSDCPDDVEYDNMMWHAGFDSESLCVWDLRAFDEVEYVEVEF